MYIIPATTQNFGRTQGSSVHVPTTIGMTLIDQEIRVIRSIDLAWRPRGAINRTPDETEKQKTKNT